LFVDIIAVILPIALAVSAAFVYQRFNETNQLIALLGAGYSPRKILIPLIYMSAIATSYLYISHLCISPYAWKKFRSLEFQIKNHIEPPQKAGSIFSHNGFSVYAQKYLGDMSFENLFVMDARNPDKICHYFAQRGMIADNILILTMGECVEIDFLKHKNSMMRFQLHNYDLRNIIESERKPEQPNEKTFDRLLQAVIAQKKADIVDESTKTTAALFHQKITSPPLAGIFSLMAFLQILLAPYRRKPSNLRMLILIIGILGFQGCYFWIANAAARNPEYVLLNYALVVSFLVVLTVLIEKKHRL
jgi:lipopolysaccharide export system permease protein